MTKKAKKAAQPAKDPRTKVIGDMWFCATGMLAIALALGSSMRYSFIAPIAILSGATVGTVVVWKSRPEEERSPTALPPQALAQLEERLANLEAIATRGELDLAERIERLEAHDS